MWPVFFLVGGAALASRSALRYCKANNIKMPKIDISKYRKMDGFAPTMTRIEAMKVLNLTPANATNAAEIRKVHQKLLLRNHPDRGGSTYIATKINEAKEVLSGKK